jgi:uncharacterized protein
MFIGILLGGFVGYFYGHTVEAALRAMFICAILTILEVSISFDNAVVNAGVLKDMSDLWQKRFLTWGMLIAVFGMRLIFPLLIVVLVTGLGPIESLKLAAFNPDEYARVMLSVHHEVAAFGGSFLLLVALKYFFNVNKDVHWIAAIEKPLVKIGKLESVEVALALLIIFVLSHFVPPEEALPFVYSGIGGVITFLIVEGISTFLKVPSGHEMDVHRASLGMFLYLEVLDASFSFDGVVGAFAITHNLFIITIGLSIGAMFVRSLTILMVEKGTLKAFRFLENGAFWAVASLAIIMFLNTVTHIPEIITGLIGAAFIGMSIYSSRKKNII